MEATFVDDRTLVTIVDAEPSGPLRDVLPSRDATRLEMNVETADHGTIVTIAAPPEPPERA